MALRITQMKDSSLIARRLGACPRVLCASPQYLERRGRPRHPPQLAEHDCLTFRLNEAGSLWRPGADLWRLEGPDGQIEVPVSGLLRVDLQVRRREPVAPGAAKPPVTGGQPTRAAGPPGETGERG